jgi:alpha-galactosidase
MENQRPEERRRVEEWVTQTLLAETPPFSFLYDGRPSAEFVSRWERREETAERAHHRLGEGALVLTDPETHLEVRCSYSVFLDFPAVEWVLHLRNGGDQDTALIEDVQALDAVFSRSGDEEFVLHRVRGSAATRMDFAPEADVLAPGGRVALAPVGGRSSNTHALPFFHLTWDGGGVVLAIGWSGQWAASWAHNEHASLQVRAGMERTRLRLHPGETIRTPRILLLFWQGEEPFRGNNLLRRFLLTHRCPQKDGNPVLGPLACTGSPGVDAEFNMATEYNQLASAERYRQFGLEADYWWIDAGWYEGRWPNGVGNWFPRQDGFPNGLRPVSDGVKKMGYEGLLLWFEPERVHRGTWLDGEHPDWVLRLPGNPNGLLNLGHPDALRWLTEHLSGMIEREGLSVYRQDFNMDPLPYWRARDEPEREGIHEIRHVEGLYALWDELRRRHPGLLIDNCASGGRRIDLETTARSIPLWRTDYQYFEPNGQQLHTYGLNLFLPLHGTGSGRPDVYAFRSAMNSAIVLGWYLWETNFPAELGRRCIAEYRRVRHLFHGDYYPLTPHSTSDDIWIAYQFHRDDRDEGMVLAFRRPDSAEGERLLNLHALDLRTTYTFQFVDSDEERTLTGAEARAGVLVRIEEPRRSALILYSRRPA